MCGDERVFQVAGKVFDSCCQRSWRVKSSGHVFALVTGDEVVLV